MKTENSCPGGYARNLRCPEPQPEKRPVCGGRGGISGGGPGGGCQAIERYSGMAGRGRSGGQGILLYDESYNSNPDSAPPAWSCSGEPGTGVWRSWETCWNWVPTGTGSHGSDPQRLGDRLRLVILVGEGLGGVFRGNREWNGFPTRVRPGGFKKGDQTRDRVLVREAIHWDSTWWSGIRRRGTDVYWLLYLSGGPLDSSTFSAT